jgi:hypothetical protein
MVFTSGRYWSRRYAMRKHFISIVIITIVLSTPSIALAAYYYVRPGATGANNGSDWTNAYTAIPTNLVRGATYYLADGNYGSLTLNTAVSGTQIITLKKATIANHGTNTGWHDSYGNGQAVFLRITVSTGYWIIDGTSRTGPTSGHGIVIDTRSHRGKGATVTGAHNTTFRYVAFIGSGPDDNLYSNDLIYELGGAHSFTLQYSYFFNSGRTHILTRGGDNWLVEYSYFDTNESTAAQHSQSFSTIGSNNWEVRYNTFINIEGTAVLSVGNAGGWKVHGNIFDNYKENVGNGIFAGWTKYPITSGYFYNNTIVNSGLARVGFTNDTNIIAKNNVYVNNNKVVFTATHDFNAFSGSNNFGEPNAQTGLTSSVFENFVGRNYRLSGGTAAGDASIGSGFGKDPDGKTRGSNGNWDRGAFEFVGTAGSPPPVGKTLPSPGNLSVR